jgi:hypothetical protein
MNLRARPRAPLGASWSIIASGSVPGEWEPYLEDRRSVLDEAAAIAG